MARHEDERVPSGGKGSEMIRRAYDDYYNCLGLLTLKFWRLFGLNNKTILFFFVALFLFHPPQGDNFSLLIEALLISMFSLYWKFNLVNPTPCHVV